MSAALSADALRSAFLAFFEARGHRVVRSSSLVPANDPTLLFTNAGMNQFKDVFLGLEKRDYARATTSQKCVRAGGKHNDLENVGYTRRHHTFFEMLGNFSFGDYFKTDAIAFAWELVTKGLRSRQGPLYVTVFREDDDAEELWQKVAACPRTASSGSTRRTTSGRWATPGPCGPCSEIHYDLGDRCRAEEAASTSSSRVDARRPLRRDLEPGVHAVRPRRPRAVLTPLPAPFDRHGHGPRARRRRPARASSRTTTPTSSCPSSRRPSVLSGKAVRRSDRARGRLSAHRRRSRRAPRRS